MAVTSVVNVTMSHSGTSTGTIPSPVPAITNSTSIDLRMPVALAANTFYPVIGTSSTAGLLPAATSLSGTKGMIIIPGATNTQPMTLKGVTGDTGWPISTTDPTEVTWVAGTPPVSGGVGIATTSGTYVSSAEILFF